MGLLAISQPVPDIQDEIAIPNGETLPLKLFHSATDLVGMKIFVLPT